jgi:hypothetical protein
VGYGKVYSLVKMRELLGSGIELGLSPSWPTKKRTSTGHVIINFKLNSIERTDSF